MASTTPNSAGTISVPISSILEALGGELTEAERTTLFQKLIGFRINEVQPGDLIRAALFNQMLGDINDLAIRVAKLEAGVDTRPKKPVIDQVLPHTVRTGEQFTVLGENLDPGQLSRIDIGNNGVPLDSTKPGSGPTQLVLEAPAIIGLPPAGATVIIAVSNAAGTAQGSYVQLPAVAPIQALVGFTLKSVTPDHDTIQPNTAYDYSFEIDIRSTHDERFVLVPQIGGAGWSAVVKGGDPNITVTAASHTAPVTVTKVITVTTAASGFANLVLNLHGTNSAFNTSSAPLEIRVRAEQEIPDDTIRFETVSPSGQPNTKWDGSALLIRRQAITNPPTAIGLSVRTKLMLAALYDVGNPTATPSAHWTAQRTSSASIDAAAGVAPTIVLSITPKTSAAIDGALSFTVSSNNGHQRTFTAGLRIVDTIT